MRSRRRRRLQRASRQVVYPLTHDVRKLLQLCAEVDKDLASAVAPAAGLTQFAVRFRYPGEDQPTREEALPWLELARLVCAEVRLRMQIDAAREACSEVSVGPAEKSGEGAQAGGENPGINGSTVVKPKDGSGAGGSE